MRTTLEITFAIRQPEHLGITIKQPPQNVKIQLDEPRSQMLRMTTDGKERSELLKRWAEQAIEWIGHDLKRYKIERVKSFGEYNIHKISALCLL